MPEKQEPLFKYVGSMTPLPVDLAAWKERLDRPGVREYLGAGRADRVWAHMAVARSASRGLTATETNRDLHPRDEFNAR